MKQFILAIALAILLVAAAFAGPADDAYGQANQLKNKGDNQGAISAAVAGLAAEPDNFGLNNLLGELYLSQARYDSSLYYYQKALAKKGKDPDALYGAGMAAFNLKLFDEAMQYFQQGDKTGKLKGKFLYGMGLVQMEKGEYPKADLNFRKAIDKDKKNPQFHLALADVNYRTRTYPIAISEYSKAIEIDSSLYYKNRDIHYRMAQAQLNMRNIPKAIEEYKTDLELFPADTTAWMELGKIYEISNNIPEAIFCYEKYLNLAGEHGDLWFNLGKLYLKVPDQEKASGAFEKAISLGSNQAESYGYLAKIYADRKEYDRAYDAYTRFEGAFGAPDSADYWIEKGKVLMKIGEKNPVYFDTALAAFDKALTINPGLSAAYEYAGLTMYYEKNYARAIGYFNKKIELDSTSVNTWRNLAFAYLKTEQYGPAANAFARALDLKPDDVIMRSMLGKIYSVNENWDRAIDQYEYILSHNGEGSSDSLKCEIYPELGFCYLSLGKYQASLGPLLKAERCNSRDETVMMNIAAAYQGVNSIKEANTYYKKVLAINPKNKGAIKGEMETRLQGKD